jgi:arylformamidase
MTTDLIDISIPLSHGMIHWPGDPAVSITMLCDVANGDPATVRHLSLGSHTGTHVDAPCHFIAGSASLSDIPLSHFCGPVRVIDCPNTPVITAHHLAKMEIDWSATKRVVFKTDNSATRWFEAPFNPHFVHLAPDAAQFLVQRHIELVGTDYLSVDGFTSVGAPVHHILLAQTIVILEGLYLGHVVPGIYDLIMLPLPLDQGDGAPARAVLRPLPAIGMV